MSFEPEVPAPPTSLAQLEERVRSRGLEIRRRKRRMERSVLAGAMVVLVVGCMAIVLPTGDKTPLRLTERTPTTAVLPTLGPLPQVGVSVPSTTRRGPAPVLTPLPRPTPTLPRVSAPVARTHGTVVFDLGDVKEYQWDVAVLVPGGTGSRVVTPKAASKDRRPVLSPDGRRIAFTSNRDNPMGYLQTVEDIYVMDIDGNNVQRLTTVPVGNYYGSSYPTWSPDGTRIAYTTDTDHSRTSAVWVMNADGSNQHPIAEVAGAYNTIWSPDGARIAVSAYQDSAGAAAWTVNPDGTDLRRVTAPVPAMWTSWLADGRLLLDRQPSSERPDDKTLSALDLATGVETRLPRPADLADIRACGRDQLIGTRDNATQLVITGLDGSSPTVIETGPPGWRLGSMSCTDPRP